MASKKISELTAAGALTGAELVEIVQGGTNKQSTTQDIANLGGGGGGTVESVTGDGVDNTDPDNPVLTFPIASEVVFTPAGTISATTVQAAIEEVAAEAGGGTIASQATVNTGTNDTEIVSPVKLKNRDGAVAVLTDGATVDITSDKNTLATSAATRTFTISHVGDDITMLVTLSATSSLYTFPAAALCVSEGVASGNNTCSLAGVSGDLYLISLKKIGSVYLVACKNWGQ